MRRRSTSEVPHLKHHVELVFSLVDLIQLADVLVWQLLECSDLSTDPWQVFTERLFVHDLDGDSVTSQTVITQLHLGKPAFTHTGAQHSTFNYLRRISWELGNPAKTQICMVWMLLCQNEEIMHSKLCPSQCTNQICRNNWLLIKGQFQWTGNGHSLLQLAEHGKPSPVLHH